MKKIKYVSHKLEENVEDIKALALYFDHIDIVEQNNIHIVTDLDAKPNAEGFVKAQVVETRDYTSDLFIAHLKDFEKENVISYSKHIVNPPKAPAGLHSMSENTIINNLILTENLLGKSEELGNFVNEEGQTIINMRFELNKESLFASKLFPKTENIDKLLFYYSRLLRSYFDNINNGEDVITTSKFLNELYYLSLKNNAFGDVSKEMKKHIDVSPSIAFQAIKLNVPNLGSHPISEILEFRLKSNDELLEFKKTLETLTIDLFDKYDENYIAQNAQKLVELKVQPKLEDLKAKLSESKFKGFQQTVQELKDPKSYSPLILTITENVSSTMAILVSLGLVSFNVALEYYNNTKNVKKDGIQYLLKLQKYYG